MGHKYIKRAGTWQMNLRYCDTSTVIRTCPICMYSQPLDANLIWMVDFRTCPKCNAVLDMPKTIKY